MVTTMGLLTGEIGSTITGMDTGIHIEGGEDVKGLWIMRSGYLVIGLGYPMVMRDTSEGT
tara:strand:+ start:5477 stop:5656 length:180 start_codon:yes stop_codon:yes gene_type:complete